MGVPMNRYFTIALLATTAAAGFSTPVFAGQATPAAENEVVGVEEIIVEARRRNESLQETPVAITAVNAAMLESKASMNIGDLQGAAPNLLITQQNSGAQAANLSIRGLTYADIEKSQEPTVGVVIDGVFVGTNTGQLLDTFDIGQIEVLRGPQGTLFGRNTIGGVINIRRTRPTMEFGGKAEISYSKWNTWQARGVLNVGNGESIGLKTWYFHNESDGYYRNGITGKRAGGSNNDNFGAALLLKPVDSNFEALLTVEKLDQQFQPVNSSISNSSDLICAFAPANQCNRNTTSDLYTVFVSPATSTYKAPAATLEMNYDAGAVKITSITGWRKGKEFQTQDFDAVSSDFYYVLRRQNYRQWSQELRFAGDIGENFDYVVGGFYFNSRYNLTQFSRVGAFNETISPDVFDTNPQNVIGKTESYAAFGDFNWAFADRWRLSFGGRWTRDQKELTNSFRQAGVIGTGDGTFKKFTPKVGVDFRPNRDTMLYASWSRGYRSGGFSPRAATAATAGTPYQPETVDSYEIGGKFDLFDRKLTFNAAGFVSKYKDLQQNTTIPGGPTGNQTITSNVGSATIKGIEADLTARPTDGLRLTATVGILDSKFKNFVVGNVSPVSGLPIPFDYSRNNLIYAPKFSGSLGAEYTVPTSFGKVVSNVGLRHISPYDQQISLGAISGNLTTGPVIVNGNDPRVRVKTQNLLDAAVTANFSLAGKDAYLTVFGRNILDQKRTNAAFTVAGLFSFASAIEPANYGATLGVKF
ncbi:MAG: TonB-dependent receptor [Pseudomonadota bacterium]|uniref:TonB-dependent receptor n=1 Tax=Rhizorhabdus phycosphaerae TaxID=2711156 RepID=UPI001D017306|nr:TonB-dependent receptor [Rhizorhabdus phycosphaerae]